jgi:hypothetical protein
MALSSQGYPLDTCRGFDTFDVNDQIVLIHAPVEQVGYAFEQAYQVLDWHRDIYGETIQLSNHSIVTFQLLGHSWTIVRELSNINRRFIPVLQEISDEKAILISRTISAKAIVFCVSDTGGYIGYHFYDCGESVEHYLYREHLMEKEGRYNFKSQLRQPKLRELRRQSAFVDDFLRTQDAFAPYFFAKSSRRVGENFSFVLQGITREDFIRMDYLKLE